ncbi:MAG: hypothetical protein ACOYZ6_14560 [Chloroflexota bacterium]
MTSFEIVTAVVAIAGLGLSIYNLYVTRRDKKPLLHSKISYGFREQGSKIGEPMLILEVANAGEKTVRVVSVDLDLGKKKITYPFIDGTQRFPFDLPSGQNAIFWTPKKEVMAKLQKGEYKGKVKLRAVFSDAIGTAHVSKPLRLPVNN